MCGLVGLLTGKSATNFATREMKKAMSTLLYLDTFRGHHATGVLTMEKKEGKYVGKYLKEPIPGHVFVDTSAYTKLSGTFSYAKLVMGHNRYATMGGLSKTAAHPHVTDNIVLSHNGTLTRFQDLAKQAGGLNEMDSARIAYELEENGSTADIFTKLHGAYALTWVDHRTGCFYIARNDERPLWYAVVEKQLLMYASNKWMLEAVQSICKLKFDVYPKQVASLSLWEISLDDFEVKYTTDNSSKSYYEFEGIKETPFENAPTVSHQYPTTYNHQQSYTHNAGAHAPFSNNKSTDPQVVSEIERSNKVLKNTGYAVGQSIEVLVDYVHFGTKKKKTGGVGFGVTASKPSISVVIVDVADSDMDDDAYSYNATIVGAATKKEENSTVTHIYVKLKELNRVCLTAEQYSNVFSGDSKQAEELRKILGNEIVVPAAEHEIVPGPNGTALAMCTYLELIKGGCSKCAVDLVQFEPSSVAWDYANKPVCPTCHESQKVLNFVGLEEDDSNRVFMEAV